MMHRSDVRNQDKSEFQFLNINNGFRQYLIVQFKQQILHIINQKQYKITNKMGNNQGNDHQKSSGMHPGGTSSLIGFENKPLTLCYANSIFQVLYHHPIFCKILQSHKNQEGMIAHLRDLKSQMSKKNPKESVSTEKIMKIIQKKSLIFDRQHHQDSHQFFIWLLNEVNDQLKKQKKETELQRVFMSKRVTRIRCLRCQNVTQSTVQDIDFSLFLPQPNVSLNNCIQQYSKVEKLSGSNKFKCDKCDSLQDAQKTSLIKTLPKFLSIHLRRFKYDQIKKGMIKLNWLIPFPFKLKLKTNYSQDHQENGMYKLVGVISHIGQGQSYGHYISYIKIDNQWFEFNDDQIRKIDDYMLESLWGYKGLTKCAYMLFYTL